jgi:DnaJ-class molecular chaperone
MTPCPHCGGHGTVTVRRVTRFGESAERYACPAYRGVGRNPDPEKLADEGGKVGGHRPNGDEVTEP